MPFAVSGFSAISQNYITRTIASNFYQKLPLLAAFGALTLGNQDKDVLDIGRPGVGEILSGKAISPAERLSLGTVNFYQPRIQGFETNNSKWLAERDTMPVTSNPTTHSPAQAVQNAAKFAWAELVTPILIWHEDKIRAEQGSKTKEGQALAMSQLVDEATEIATQEHVKQFNQAVHNGNPSSQSAMLWSTLLGLAQAYSTSNTYGNVNRSTEPLFRAQVDSTLTSTDIRRIVDDANLTKLCRIKGPGINLIVTNPYLFRVFKNQIQSQNGAGMVLANGLPKMAKMGVTQECLQVDNVYIIYDPTIPDQTAYTMTAGTWRFMFHPARNFRVGKFTDISEATEGAKDADQAFIRTRCMFTCDNPYLNVAYTALGPSGQWTPLG